MDRRVFLSTLGGGLLAAPLAARAQQAAKVYRIGRLSLSAFDARPGHETSDAVLDGLRELGYVEGRDFLLERRDANGISDRLPKLAEELVRIPVDVLLVTGVTATAAARRATGTIPIVCMMGDPVGQGFVKSLAHPGANITGVTLNTGGSDLGVHPCRSVSRPIGREQEDVGPGQALGSANRRPGIGLGAPGSGWRLAGDRTRPRRPP